VIGCAATAAQNTVMKDRSSLENQNLHLLPIAICSLTDISAYRFFLGQFTIIQLGKKF
jgi:hypothetical protein